jgi:type VI secretion system protein ImpH
VPLSEQELDDAVRCRPELSLAFAPADVATIDQVADDPKKYQLTVTFLGLYGASSPLPTFYTEDLLDEWRESQELCRHFFDLINQGLYTLLFRGWAKYQLAYQLHENNNERTSEHLFALFGLPEQLWRAKLRTPQVLLRYIGLTSQTPRSAAGLQALIRDWLENDQVEVEQCIQRRVAIPKQQQLHLGMQGCLLGEETFLGQEMEERSSKFRLSIKAINGARFHSLLPDRPAFAEVVHLVHLYVNSPLVWDLQLSLPQESVQAATLGGGDHGSWAQLGWNTWLRSEGAPLEPEQTSVCLMGPAIGDQVHCHPTSPYAKGGSTHA